MFSEEDSSYGGGGCGKGQTTATEQLDNNNSMDQDSFSESDFDEMLSDGLINADKF